MTTTPSTLNVTLTPESSAEVKKLLESGCYTSPADVIQEALELLAERAQRKEALRRELQKAMEQVKQGKVLTHEEVWAEFDLL
jgi:putative addiction module CopG family antidote